MLGVLGIFCWSLGFGEKKYVYIYIYQYINTPFMVLNTL